jgi:YhcH/YjgK/YiaL family protein
MIVDHLDHGLLYGGLGRKIAVGLALLGEERVRESPPGRYPVEGEDIFYIVDEYEAEAVEAGRLEIHRKYMDIQFLISGCECIGHAPLEGLVEQAPYDGDKDAAFYDVPAGMSRLILKAGMFAIFWPNEPHLPGRSAESVERVKKIVVKIRME